MTTSVRRASAVIIAGHGRVAMPPSIAFLTNRWATGNAAARRDVLGIALIALPHLAALGLMVWSEAAVVPKVVFLLTWGLFNFFWLMVLRRPAVSSALSLAHDRRSDPALAAQIRHDLDDRQFPRSHDHR